MPPTDASIAPPGRPGARRGRNARRVLGLHWETLAILVVLIVAWEVSSGRSLVERLFFPPPSAWMMALLDLATDGSLAADIGATLTRLLRGLVPGLVLGYGLGLLLGEARRAHDILDPFIAFLHPLPKIALFPLLLLLLGTGEPPKTAIVAITVFFPMFVNTVLGVREIDPALLDVARSHRASSALVLRRVVLPASVPAAMAGLRLAVNTALTVAIALELLTAGEGLGARIWKSWQNLQSERLFAALLVIALLGHASNVLIRRLDHWLVPWRATR